MIIRNTKDCDTFWKLYGINESIEENSKNIKKKKYTKKKLSYYLIEHPRFDFNEVSKNFAGLEFKQGCRYNYFSQPDNGVIWNTDIIKDLVHMYP